MLQIADEFNAAIVITNQVMSDPSGGAMFVSDPKKAIGEAPALQSPCLDMTKHTATAPGLLLTSSSKAGLQRTTMQSLQHLAGGHVIAHASTVRLSLRKGKAEQRLIKVVDAPNLGAAAAGKLWG